MPSREPVEPRLRCFSRGRRDARKGPLQGFVKICFILSFIPLAVTSVAETTYFTFKVKISHILQHINHVLDAIFIDARSHGHD